MWEEIENIRAIGPFVPMYALYKSAKCGFAKAKVAMRDLQCWLLENYSEGVAGLDAELKMECIRMRVNESVQDFINSFDYHHGPIMERLSYLPCL